MVCGLLLPQLRLFGVCQGRYPPTTATVIMRSQTSERGDDVSPYLMVSCAAGAREKIPRTFADSVGLFNLIVLNSLLCVLVC